MKRRPLFIYDFATVQLTPSEFPDMWGKFYFIFYQCKIRILWEKLLLFGKFLSMLRKALIGRDRICVLGPIVDVDSCLLFYFQVIYGSHILFCKFLSADLFSECKKLAYLSRKYALGCQPVPVWAKRLYIFRCTVNI